MVVVYVALVRVTWICGVGVVGFQGYLACLVWFLVAGGVRLRLGPSCPVGIVVDVDGRTVKWSNDCICLEIFLPSWPWF